MSDVICNESYAWFVLPYFVISLICATLLIRAQFKRMLTKWRIQKLERLLPAAEGDCIDNIGLQYDIRRIWFDGRNYYSVDEYECPEPFCGLEGFKEKDCFYKERIRKIISGES